MIKGRIFEPHQLSGTASSVFGAPMLCKAEVQHHHPIKDYRQPVSCDLYKQNGRDPLSGLLQPGNLTVELEPAAKHIPACRVIPGKENTVADQESRASRDRCDWMLNPHVFNQIQSLMGPCEMDLFALHLTKQLQRFFSWRPDPEAEGTDAFSQNWVMAKCYASPPWCLIAQCLSQVRRQMARMVIITPLWNSQPWFPTILGPLENFPRLLPVRTDLVVLPTMQEFVMKQGVPELVAWPISGDPLHHKEFLQWLQSSSCLPGDLIEL